MIDNTLVTFYNIKNFHALLFISYFLKFIPVISSLL